MRKLVGKRVGISSGICHSTGSCTLSVSCSGSGFSVGSRGESAMRGYSSTLLDAMTRPLSPSTFIIYDKGRGLAYHRPSWESMDGCPDYITAREAHQQAQAPLSVLLL